MFLGGTKQLLNQPEFKDPERIRELLSVLEEEQMLKDMLMADKDSGIKVTIGSEKQIFRHPRLQYDPGHLPAQRTGGGDPGCPGTDPHGIPEGDFRDGLPPQLPAGGHE